MLHKYWSGEEFEYFVVFWLWSFRKDYKLWTACWQTMHVIYDIFYHRKLKISVKMNVLLHTFCQYTFSLLKMYIVHQSAHLYVYLWCLHRCLRNYRFEEGKPAMFFTSYWTQTGTLWASSWWKVSKLFTWFKPTCTTAGIIWQRKGCCNADKK